jgi:hypothetical protein
MKLCLSAITKSLMITGCLALFKLVRYHSDFNFAATKDDVVIIDEGDFVLFKDPAKFAKEVKKRSTICFTASPPKEDHESLEDEIYKSLGFNYYTC